MFAIYSTTPLFAYNPTPSMYCYHSTLPTQRRGMTNDNDDNDNEEDITMILVVVVTVTMMVKMIMMIMMGL